MLSTKPKYRIVNRQETIGKARLLEIMREMEPGLTVRQASASYDRLTRAINGLMNAYARALPKGIHVRIRLQDCCTINLCWIAGKSGQWADRPRAWLSLGARVRGRLQDLKIAEHKRWKARQNPPGTGVL